MNKLFSKINLKNIAIILMIAIFFMADRYLKILASSRATEEPIKLIDGLFSFNFTANYYIAFSLPLKGWLLNIIIILIILALIYSIFYLLLNKKNQERAALLLTIILLGAISNILDRLTCGYVIDYLELKHFTVFNLADAMISFGALILLFNHKNGGTFEKNC